MNTKTTKEALIAKVADKMKAEVIGCILGAEPVSAATAFCQIL
uniref:Uncharacterized protein n=1 Tax=Cyanothece sp. (strain PCC 7425 / ATCC 29141) TaxID=395961 RepID=B8HYR6_CYAP4